MATTTPNFGWPVPTSTDLVKDGATAIEALGDGVDASLVDLKGGTTGQVLSKNSNTDMDFVWVTDAAGDITAVTAGTGISGGGTSGAVTITNSMATAIDAKGDLVPGTGADAFARLAVGANYGFLQADSAQSTGLAWNAGAWTTYTPTVTATTGSYTTITVNGGYQRIGKTCVLRAYIQVDSVGTAAGSMIVTLPFQAAAFRQSGTGADLAVSGYAASVLVEPSATTAIVRKYDFTTFWSTNTGVAIQITYEVA